MSDNIIITVGIIARNEEKHIKETLISIINQNFSKDEYEIILIDGNSEDRTKEIAFETLKNSKMSFKILNEKDFGFYGPCFARNLVIDNSYEFSKYIAFIDADCIADKNWLPILYNRIESKQNNEEIAGVGGSRLIAKTNDNMEIIINSILTSHIATWGNPAFSNRKIEYIKSIPNYNAIYKKEILKNFRYDDKLVLSDDIELNYRLSKHGYKFLYEPNSKIYHHETGSIVQFSKNMFRYGVNISNVIKKYKNPFIRIYAPITVLFVISPILLIFIALISNYASDNILILVLPYIAYLFFVLLVFLEVFFKTKKMVSLITLILVPIQHFYYGIGIIFGLIG
ncbi:glycosyltransferase involved in cell wall biosynthesis [Methanococcus maripaludis]|uniref:Glycosyltransferase involved in cell wall biosynthesis n=1 Tax=Methanococcus maripaludis TaxID=39152 RepID=A0A7J9NGY8_METMI|nr:glycosyltransferase [Methanococcus maripaludis]MBA2840134.1 glycosyltransferase involved in cell wall biosynthesis [Methanococcus maripaludis]